MRVLALDRANHEATAGRKLTFEVEDSRGNKVFKKVTQTDAFGIASAEFGLADEVNLGTYHLRALMDNGAGGATNTAELALNVERYVLPKFKVAVEFAGKDAHAKRGYRPGDHVTGTVRANYFFGKPVDGAEITVKATAMDVALVGAGSAQGKTDSDGTYHFDLQLPAYFAGLPLNHGAARVLIEATVKDSAGHAETRGEPITVSQIPLVLTAIPEGGTLVPNLENQVFLLASYPDGTPAAANLKIRAAGNADQTAITDAGRSRRHPPARRRRHQNPQVEAADAEGNRAATTVPLELRQGEDQILLRTERAVYRAGDRIQLKIFSTSERGTAYIDVVKNGQTVLTRDLDLVNGQAELTLPATPDLAGTVDFNAYLFGRDARPVADHRLVFVQPADELKIEATADAAVYKPGDEARIRFRVTNSHGEGVQAALGLQVVDEAVFALAEKQPGFAKVFFYLEQEVMKPRYEIHSIGMPDIVEPVPTAESRAARPRRPRPVRRDRNGQRQQVRDGIRPHHSARPELAAYSTRYQARFQQLAQQLRARASRIAAQAISPRFAAKNRPARSPGTPLCVSTVSTGIRNTAYYLVRSAGPDKRFDTVDDFSTILRGPHPQNRRPAHLRPDRHRPANRTRPRPLQRPRGSGGVGDGFKWDGGRGRHGYRARSRHRRHADRRRQCRRTVHARRLAAGRLRAPPVLARLQDRVASSDTQGARSGRALRHLERRRRDGNGDSGAGGFRAASWLAGTWPAACSAGSSAAYLAASASAEAGAEPAVFAARQFDAGTLNAPAVPVMKQMVAMVRADLNSATLATKASVGPAARTCAPTSPRRSTSIPKSSPTATATPASPFPWPTPSPPGAWP